jgi:hypothetical protein
MGRSGSPGLLVVGRQKPEVRLEAGIEYAHEADVRVDRARWRALYIPDRFS